MIPIFKEVVEIIFKLGLIKVLFATETFAVGVNMPTRTIVFTELIKTTNMCKRFLNTAEYKQMSGRAGRRGKDTNGTVILLPLYDFPDLLDLKNVMVKTMPHIDSKFKIDYEYCLKTLKSKKTDIFDKSLLNKEHNNNLQQYQEDLIKQEELLTNHNFNKYLDKLDDCNKLDKLTNNNSDLGFNIKLSQKDKKQLQVLKANISSDILSLYKDYKDLQSNIYNIQNNILYTTSYLEDMTKIFYDILLEHNYITNNQELTIKGICASNINECNGMLLTEIIFSNMLDKLTTHEKIGRAHV